MVAAPSWLDELPTRPGPPFLSMGVRPIDLSNWLIIDQRTPEEMAEKAAHARRRHDEVFRAEPGTVAAGEEVLELVRRWCTLHLGVVPRPAFDAEHPLEAAAALVPEDLCLMAERDGSYVLVAASVSFPSHWRLEEKMGEPLARIHAPVAHYADELERKVDTFFARLPTDRLVVRRNLSVHDHEDLFRPEPPETYEHFTGTIDDLWLRSERQTLVRLPRTNHVLFTIKTQRCPAAALADRPDVRHALAARYAAIIDDAAARGAPAHVPAWFPTWLASDGAPA